MPPTSRAGSIRRLVCLAGVIGPFALLTAALARAADASSIADALFHDASDLMTAGKTHEACAKFAESQRIDPQLGTLLNLALCHDKEGRTATAWSEFDELAEKSRARGDTSRETFARTHVADLERRLARIRLVLAPGAQLTELRIDGQPLGSAAWSTALPLDPGTHVFALSAEGKKTRELTVTVAAGVGIQTIEVPPFEDAVPMPAAPPLLPAQQPPVPPRATETKRDFGVGVDAPREGSAGLGAVRVAGLSVAALGVVGLGIGSIFGLMAGSSYDHLKSLCGGDVTHCTDSAVSMANSEHGTAVTYADLSTAAFIAGGALVGAGVVVFWIGGAPRPATATWAVTPNVGPGHAGLSLGRKFE